MLERLLAHLERRVGATTMLTIQRPRKGDWVVTIFRDHPKIDEVVYASGHGDTLADALHELLHDPLVETGI